MPTTVAEGDEGIAAEIVQDLEAHESNYIQQFDIVTASFPSTARGESSDEAIDVNHDGLSEFRRLTQVTVSGTTYTVKVLVFPPREIATTASVLYADPASHMVRANMNTVISR